MLNELFARFDRLAHVSACYSLIVGLVLFHPAFICTAFGTQLGPSLNCPVYG